MIKLFCNVSYKIGLRFNDLLKAVFAVGMSRKEKTRRGGLVSGVLSISVCDLRGLDY